MSYDKYEQDDVNLKNFDLFNQSKGWSKQQKRCFHRLNSCLLFWQSHGYQILRVDLTSSKESNSEKLRYNYRLLRRRIENELGFKNIEDFIVETSEGNGVLHMLLAWRCPDGFKEKDFFVSQRWLSKAWMKQHKASVVWVTKYRQEFAGSRKNVSRYLVAQYVTEQKGFVRYSYSWGRTFGFSLVKFWALFREYWLYHVGSDYAEVIWLWEKFCCGEELPDVVNEKIHPGRKFKTISEMRGDKIE